MFKSSEWQASAVNAFSFFWVLKMPRLGIEIMYRTVVGDPWRLKSGVILYWRRQKHGPWREKKLLRSKELVKNPLYMAMDLVYYERAIGAVGADACRDTIKNAITAGGCHKHAEVPAKAWLANCPKCAAVALSLADYYRRAYLEELDKPSLPEPVRPNNISEESWKGFSPKIQKLLAKKRLTQ